MNKNKQEIISYIEDLKTPAGQAGTTQLLLLARSVRSQTIVQPRGTPFCYFSYREKVHTVSEELYNMIIMNIKMNLKMRTNVKIEI